MKNINGLVLMGGSSQRMGMDKALLVYDKVPEYQRIYQLLEPFCDHVFLSEKSSRISDLPYIIDNGKYELMGPVAGILTAFEKIRSPWIVLAIDYPMFQKNDLLKLIEERDPDYMATVYYNPETLFYEPFLAIYEPAIQEIILKEIEIGNYSLQTILKNNKTNKVFPHEIQNIKSIDLPSERLKIITQKK